MTQKQTPPTLTQVQSAFDLPFDEQIEFFRQKVRLPTQGYQDLTAQNHDKAFVVAGAMKADLLNDLHKAVLSAIENGDSLGQFSKNFDSIAKKYGWTAGEGNAWRAKIVYQTNLRVSHSAGRYHQMRDPDLLKARPYWQYRHITADNPRLHHKRLNNMVLRADDAWWTVNYPPLGFGCKCYARTLSQADMDRMGLTVSQTPDILGYADDSFAHAHGSSWYPNLDKYPYQIAKAMVASNMATGVFERWLGRIDNQMNQEIAKPDYQDLTHDQIVKKLRSLDTNESFSVAVIPPEFMEKLGVSTQVVKLSEYDALKQAYSRKGDAMFEWGDYLAVQGIFDNPQYVLKEVGVNGQVMTVWLQHQEKSYMAVLQQTKTGKGLFLKSFRTGKMEREIKRSLKTGGEIIYQKD